MGTHVNVFLLVLLPARRLFYSEVVEPPAPEVPEHPGLRGRLEVWFHRLVEGWQTSHAAAARWIRGVWHWLQRRTHPDEVLLARLRKARSIDLNHPASVSGDEALSEWSAFLASARRRHWPWFVVNTVVSPLTVLLAPLPGPNLIGYWIAYRAVHHLFILIGLRRARSGRIETRLRPAAALDPVADGEEAALRLAKLGCDPAETHEFLERRGLLAPVPANAITLDE